MPDRPFIRIRLFGGPRDGHEVEWPAPPPETYSVPTWNGTWIRDLVGPLPDDLSTGDYVTHEYVLTGDGPDSYRYEFSRSTRAS